MLAIGGLREKTMAAYAAGVRTILIPADNLKDLKDVDAAVRENVTFIPCSKASEILANALVYAQSEAVSSVKVKKTESDALVIPTSSVSSVQKRARARK